MNEPRWRQVLCWGAVITFFSIPLIIFTLHVMAIELGWKFDDRLEEFQGIMPVYQTVTALIFGLAGLNSFDRFTNGKKKNGSPSN
jgi:hypothetical protein